MFNWSTSDTELGQRRSEELSGVGASTLLQVLMPLIEKRLEGLLVELKDAKPELNILLNLKAQIGELIRIKQELEHVKNLGKEAGEAIQKILIS